MDVRRVATSARRLGTGSMVALVIMVMPVLRQSSAPSYAEQQATAPSDQSAYYVPTTISAEWQAALKTWTGPTDETFPGPNDLDRWRALQREGERFIGRMSEALLARYQPTITPRELGGVPVLDIRPRDWQDNGRVLVYTHGGAYTFNSARSTLSSSVPVADATGLRVISVDYSLAPHSRWDQTTDQVVAVNWSAPPRPTRIRPIRRTRTSHRSMGTSLKASRPR